MSPLSQLVGRGITDYSDRVKGTYGNHGHSVCFDVTDGYIGITQFEGDGPTVTDRVLLSPAQFEALLAFLPTAAHHRRTHR